MNIKFILNEFELYFLKICAVLGKSEAGLRLFLVLCFVFWFCVIFLSFAVLL